MHHRGGLGAAVEVRLEGDEGGGGEKKDGYEG